VAAACYSAAGISVVASVESVASVDSPPPPEQEASIKAQDKLSKRDRFMSVSLEAEK
jgi:hypothetical protein